MSRVLVTLTMLLLSMDAVAAALPTHPLSGPAGILIRGPTFRYILKQDRNPHVCEHMLQVFNDKFAHLWDQPMLTSPASEPSYSANGKYAFPLLPGVKHSTKAIFETRFSAWPTSPEFSAVHWKEGRAVSGGCPAGKICAGEEPQPILIAHFDFDNDGSIDTVIKEGGEFFQGYGDMSHVREYLIVWRGRTLKVSGAPSLWDLEHPRDMELRPITMWGTYLRPFIYLGVTYVASYESEFGAGSSTYPVREDMLIERYYFAGRKQAITHWPEWSSKTVCDLRMKRMKN